MADAPTGVVPADCATIPGLRVRNDRKSEARSREGRLHWDMTELLICVVFKKSGEKIVEMAARRSLQFASLDVTRGPARGVQDFNL
jgi:hypothetical protein